MQCWFLCSKTQTLFSPFERTRSLSACRPTGCLCHAPARATTEQRAGNLHRDQEPQGYPTINKHTHKPPVSASTQPAGGLQRPHSNYRQVCDRVHMKQVDVLTPPNTQSPLWKVQQERSKKFLFLQSHSFLLPILVNYSSGIASAEGLPRFHRDNHHMQEGRLRN